MAASGGRGGGDGEDGRMREAGLDEARRLVLVGGRLEWQRGNLGGGGRRREREGPPGWQTGTCALRSWGLGGQFAGDCSAGPGASPGQHQLAQIISGACPQLGKCT